MRSSVTCISGRIAVVRGRGATPNQAQLGARRWRGRGRLESVDLFLLGRGSVAQRLDFEEDIVDVGREPHDVAMSQAEGLTGGIVRPTEAQHARLIARPNRLARPRPAELDIT